MYDDLGRRAALPEALLSRSPQASLPESAKNVVELRFPLRSCSCRRSSASSCSTTGHFACARPIAAAQEERSMLASMRHRAQAVSAAALPDLRLTAISQHPTLSVPTSPSVLLERRARRCCCSRPRSTELSAASGNGRGRSFGWPPPAAIAHADIRLRHPGGACISPVSRVLPLALVSRPRRDALASAGALRLCVVVEQLLSARCRCPMPCRRSSPGESLFSDGARRRILSPRLQPQWEDRPRWAAARSSAGCLSRCSAARCSACLPAS